MARRIGSVTPIWNQELWIKPHFEMLSKLDRNLVVLQERPLPNYHKEHGYSAEADLSEKILREQFSTVEIVPSHFPADREFGAELYNEGLRLMKDCDIVFRLDPDMFFEKGIWEKLIEYIRDTNYDCYHMDFAVDSINYYMTGDYEHGLKDAKEFDPLAVNPKYEFAEVLHCTAPSHHVIKFEDFLCHHFRGWNKPKSTPNPAWAKSDYARSAFQEYSDDGMWLEVPKEIRTKMEDWMETLDSMKKREKLQALKDQMRKEGKL